MARYEDQYVSESTEKNPKATDKKQAGQERKPGWLMGGVVENVRQAGRDVLALTLGRLLEDPGNEAQEATGPQETDSEKQAPDHEREKSLRRVGALHSVAEQLRGAADKYLAAKMDEIEARVDQKLDNIENRIDEKIVELHMQLAEMRDRELRHRLRLLKLTLLFTVLVAALSLLYKWLEKFWQIS